MIPVVVSPLGDYQGYRRQGPPLVRYASPFQLIEIYRDAVFLNGTIQLEGRESWYHNELMVAVPLSVLESPRRVLILGGGLGMGARLALKFPVVEAIDVIELDPDVVRLAQHTRTLRALNERSLEDPRVRVQVGDAFECVSGSYDLIVFDCDLTATRQSAALDASSLRGFFEFLAARLNPGGAFSSRIPLDDAYLELVGEGVGSEAERAARSVLGVWPEARLCEFRSAYCGRELLVWHFPDGSPTVLRTLPEGSEVYRAALSQVFP